MASTNPMTREPEPPATPADVAEVVARALNEDVGDGDRNTVVAGAGQQAHAVLTAREAGVLAGRPWFDEVFHQLEPNAMRVHWHLDDSDPTKPGTTVCELAGPARALLTGERTALNFLQTLSGTATSTRQFVDRVKGTGADILDTRKTQPGLRSAQKYAIRCGGGINHRFGLFDGILIKENHITAAGSIAAAVASVREAHPELRVQVEVENLTEVDEALAADAESVLLDNFASHILARAVNMCRRHILPNRESVLVEASGDITLANVRDFADTEVDRISIGGLTKHVTAVDFSLRLKDGE